MPSISNSTLKVIPDGFPEFGVSRERFDQFYDKPLPKSKFYDLVNKGKILPMKGQRGMFRLNASLIRLGLPPVRELPKKATKRSQEDILRLAFTIIDPRIFPLPSWVATGTDLDPSDENHARVLATNFRGDTMALGSAEEKLGYFAGVLDALADLQNGGNRFQYLA